MQIINVEEFKLIYNIFNNKNCVKKYFTHAINHLTFGLDPENYFK
jgi:hypothetical protein